jgi:thymidylate synthase ThyX
VTTVIELILGTEIAEEILRYESSRDYVPAEVLLEDFDKIMAAVPKSTDKIDYDATTVLNVHKQLAGRGLEAYMWHTVVITGTEFENFYALRDHPEAQGEIATIARLMRTAHAQSTPRPLDYGEWHLPYVDEGEFDNVVDAVRVSAARTAAVSYNRQHAKKDPSQEISRYQALLSGGHMSPLEHQATPFSKRELRARRAAKKAAELIIKEVLASSEIADSAELNGPLQATEQLLFSGNLRGFTQHRKQILHEGNFGMLRAA